MATPSDIQAKEDTGVMMDSEDEWICYHEEAREQIVRPRYRKGNRRKCLQHPGV